MKLGSRWFMTPAGGILALVCFFLPWVKFSCATYPTPFKTVMETHTISGFEIATKQQVNLITI